MCIRDSAIFYKGFFNPGFTETQQQDFSKLLQQVSATVDSDIESLIKGLLLAAPAFAKARAISETLANGELDIAVSYTHLDVYKRQTQRKGCRTE